MTDGGRGGSAAARYARNGVFGRTCHSGARATIEPSVHAITATGAIVVTVVAALRPEVLEQLLRKDDAAGGGLVEQLTVAVLVPGIIVAVYALSQWRRLASWWVACWLGLWTLACIYFAGEECSWGQWYFGWETPEELAELNDQKEMNLHNMSSWLDQKPRAAVELFVIVGGLLAPVRMRLRGSRAVNRLSAPAHWVVAPSLCWSAAAWFLVMRVSDLIDVGVFSRLGASELRELGVAWFLTLYLFSYALRLRRRDAAAVSVELLAAPLCDEARAAGE